MSSAFQISEVVEASRQVKERNFPEDNRKIEKASKQKKQRATV